MSVVRIHLLRPFYYEEYIMQFVIGLVVGLIITAFYPDVGYEVRGIVDAILSQ